MLHASRGFENALKETKTTWAFNVPAFIASIVACEEEPRVEPRTYYFPGEGGEPLTLDPGTYISTMFEPILIGNLRQDSQNAERGFSKSKNGQNVECESLLLQYL